MPIVKTEYLNVYYEETGNRPSAEKPVLHISGTGGDLRNKPNVLDAPLSAHRHCIAYDQRGLGQTEKPQGLYTMAQYADDAAALLDALEVDCADVVGLSFGGMVAQHFAIRHPDRINKLVLCCTAPGGAHASFPLHQIPDDLGPAERLMRMLPISDTRRDAAWQADNPSLIAQLQQAAVDNYITDHATSEFKRGARLQLEARSQHDTNADLHKLRMQTLICAGRYDDGIAQPSCQEYLHANIESSQLNWYEGGHLFLLQDKSAWNDVIEFFASPRPKCAAF